MDVKTAFLHGVLHEENYIAALDGLDVTAGHVLCFRKYLNGLPQVIHKAHCALYHIRDTLIYPFSPKPTPIPNDKLTK